MKLIEIRVETASDTLLARFPGWYVPFAQGIKDVVDIPVMVGGLLDDPLLADSVIRDGSADLVALGERLRIDPDWPRRARVILGQDDTSSA